MATTTMTTGTERTCYTTHLNDWGGVLSDAARRFLRNTPGAVAVLVTRDDDGRLEVEEFEFYAQLAARMLAVHAAKVPAYSYAVAKGN